LAAALPPPPSPRVVTPDGPRRSSAASGTVVPFGTEGGAEIGEGSSFLQDDDVDNVDPILSTNETSEDSAGASHDNSIVSGVRLVSEIESDLAAAAALPPPPRVVTPDGPPRSSAASGTVVPFGTEGSAEIEEGSSFLQDDDVDIADLVVLEQGHRPTTTSGDESDSEHDVGEAPSLPESHDIASIIIRAHQQDNATDNDHGNTSGTDGVIIREYSEIGDDTFATTAGSDGILPDEGSVDDASREVDRESGPILRIDDE